MNTRTLVRGGIALLVAVLVVSALGAWMFLSDRETESRGTCGSATYELAVEPEGDRLELTFELASSGPGESWDVEIEQNRAVIFAGTRTTDEDGELDLDLPADSVGDNDFAVVAAPDGGEACTAELSHG